MWIYISASFPRKEEVQHLARWFRDNGHVICSNWHSADKTSVYDNGKSDKGDADYEAERDFDEVVRCDALVQITGDTMTRGGRHTELGIALALHKRIVVCGPRESVFHSHPRVKVVSSINHAVGALA